MTNLLIVITEIPSLHNIVGLINKQGYKGDLVSEHVCIAFKLSELCQWIPIYSLDLIHTRASKLKLLISYTSKF